MRMVCAAASGDAGGMARKPRIFVPGLPMHVLQRGNNRRPVFFNDEDRKRYLKYLAAAANEHDCAVHCYVLMTNHIHLLVTPGSPLSLANTIKLLGGRYVRHLNDIYERTGGLWEGRYRASLVDTDRYLAMCYRYIELNPVRAGIARQPAEYAWSSYRHHAHGWPDSLVTPHAFYEELGETERGRRHRYREIFHQQLADDQLKHIREATRQGRRLSRSLHPARKGRPKRGSDPIKKGV